jgi:hypothetical protein
LSLLVLLLVVSAGTWWAIAAATADSRPIIVRGHIQTNGDEVWVGVNQIVSQGVSEIPIASVETKGDFVLRGEMSPAAARKLILYVEPAGYVPASCDYHSTLPPLRLAGDRWVEDSTGEPLFAAIDLPLIPKGEIFC